MKKSIKLFSFLLIVLTIVSCNGKQKEAAKKTVHSFFKAIQKEDGKRMSKFYPAFDSIGGYYKSNRIDILETTVLEAGKIEVKVKNYYKNGLGKNFNQEIILFLKSKPDNKEVYEIYDSKGIVDFEGADYEFAVNTGCIPKKNTLSDQEVAAKLKESKDLLYELGKSYLAKLKKEVVISDWKWNYTYTNNYAEGSGKITNNSNLELKFLKYIVSFVDKTGAEVVRDDGYFTSGNSIDPGVTKSFTTFTGDIEGATAAYIAVDFDTQFIFDEVMKAKYTGNEYADFVKNKKSN